MSRKPQPEETPIGQKVITQFLSRIEDYTLALLLLVLIILSCARIFTRIFNYGGMLWADQLLRNLVLWSGFLGAAMATSRGKHISLDVISYILPPKWQSWTTFLNNIFSTITSGVLTWASVLFILSEREYSTTGLLGIPSYQWNIIFPLAFGLITLRYASKVVVSIQLITDDKHPLKSTDS